jgi:hypothetical protein
MKTCRIGFFQCITSTSTGAVPLVRISSQVIWRRWGRTDTYFAGLEHAGLEPKSLDNLALFCVRCHGLKTSMEKVLVSHLAKRAKRAGDRSVGVHSSCILRFCVVCDPGCRLTHRAATRSSRKHSDPNPNPNPDPGRQQSVSQKAKARSYRRRTDRVYSRSAA